jgi:type VI secretion system Hcp family effector
MAIDAFLTFSIPPAASPLQTKNPTGESLDAQHAGWIQIASFSLGTSNPTAVGSATMGAGAGKAAFHEFQITKPVDSASPSLFAACAAGTNFPAMFLAVRKAGATADYLRYEFHTVHVSSVEWSDGNGQDIPSESVSFAYGALGVAYHTQSATGALSPTPLTATWDQVTNTANDTTVSFTHLT